ncbi:uncharacterized protein VTP21DRAFT_7903 [Calcarisporiella thermophila]|uniref:uncharacterized protein n=1 Tax=Calcarisporiella thermophila TaxID=911321 RepID=UPI0037422A2B
MFAASEETRTKRLKVGRACQPCRRKKIKCDGLFPCMQCKARVQSCNYGRESSGELIEFQLDSPGSEACTTDSFFEVQLQSLPSPFPTSSRTNSNKGNKQQSLENSDNIDMLGALQQSLANLTVHTGEGEPSDKGTEFAVQRMSQPVFKPEPPISNSTLRGIDARNLEWPPDHVEERLVQVFFNKRNHIPILHRAEYTMKMREKENLSPLLRSIVLALATKHSPEPLRDRPAIDYFEQARRILADFLDVPRVSTIQALLLMSLYEDPSLDQRRRSSLSWMFVGMACRMCFDCRLNRYQADLEPGVERDIRIRVFWSCFILDRLFALALDRPYMIHSNSVTTPLPIWDESCRREEWELEYLEEEKQAEQNLYHLAKIIEILDHMCRLPSDEDVDEKISKVEQRLKNWNAELPDSLKLSTDIGVPLPQGAEPSSTIVGHLHMFFNLASIGIVFWNAKKQKRRPIPELVAIGDNLVRITSYLATSSDNIIITQGAIVYSCIQGCSALILCMNAHNSDIIDRAQTLLVRGVKTLHQLSMQRDFVSPEEGKKAITAAETFLKSLSAIHPKRKSPQTDSSKTAEPTIMAFNISPKSASAVEPPAASPKQRKIKSQRPPRQKNILAKPQAFPLPKPNPTPPFAQTTAVIDEAHGGEGVREQILGLPEEEQRNLAVDTNAPLALSRPRVSCQLCYLHNFPCDAQMPCSKCSLSGWECYYELGWSSNDSASDDVNKNRKYMDAEEGVDSRWEAKALELSSDLRIGEEDSPNSEIEMLETPVYEPPKVGSGISPNNKYAEYSAEYYNLPEHAFELSQSQNLNQTFDSFISQLSGRFPFLQENKPAQNRAPEGSFVFSSEAQHAPGYEMSVGKRSFNMPVPTSVSDPASSLSVDYGRPIHGEMPVSNVTGFVNPQKYTQPSEVSPEMMGVGTDAQRGMFPHYYS